MRSADKYITIYKCTKSKQNFVLQSEWVAQPEQFSLLVYAVACGSGTINVAVVVVEYNILQVYVVALEDASRKTKSTIQQKELW